MHREHFVKYRVALFAILAVAICGMSLPAQAAYTVTPIVGPAGWTDIGVGSINIYGQAAAWGHDGVHPNWQSFLSNPGGSTTVISIPGWTNVTFGESINDAGQISGRGDAGTFIWDAANGMTANFTAPTGWSYGSSLGTRINNRGQVVHASGDWQPFVYDSGAFTPLNVPGGGTIDPDLAVGVHIAMNDSGTFLVASTATNQPGGAYRQAFLADPAGAALIPVPAGMRDTYAFGVNSSGQVVGAAADGAGGYAAFIGTTAGSIQIPHPSGADSNWWSVGYSVNDQGTVVGYDQLGSYLGWMWDPVNGTRLLSDLVPAGWNISFATDITDNGYILAYAGAGSPTEGYVLLTPIPEPATLSLLALAGLSLIRRRK